MNEKPLIIGSAFGAIAAAATTLGATLCCLGPIVVTLLGVSGAVAVAKLEPYTLHLFFASFICLGVGFWLNYRPTCTGDTGCSPRTQHHIRLVLWSATILTMGTFILNRLGILAG